MPFKEPKDTGLKQIQRYIFKLLFKQDKIKVLLILTIHCDHSNSLSWFDP